MCQKRHAYIETTLLPPKTQPLRTRGSYIACLRAPSRMPGRQAHLPPPSLVLAPLVSCAGSLRARSSHHQPRDACADERAGRQSSRKASPKQDAEVDVFHTGSSRRLVVGAGCAAAHHRCLHLTPAQAAPGQETRASTRPPRCGSSLLARTRYERTRSACPAWWRCLCRWRTS